MAEWRAVSPIACEPCKYFHLIGYKYYSVHTGNLSGYWGDLGPVVGTSDKPQRLLQRVRFPCKLQPN